MDPFAGHNHNYMYSLVLTSESPMDTACDVLSKISQNLGNVISLLTGPQQGWKKIRRASQWESERRDSASEASGTRGSL